VIISEDGYIATNNHVIENASEITIILPDKREFSAELIGRDPNTDLALLKIKAEGLQP
jgi:S1-C subfamily serine protease